MKFNKFFVALMMGGMMVACAPKAEEATAEEGQATEAAEVAPKEKTAKDYISKKAEKGAAPLRAAALPPLPRRRVVSSAPLEHSSVLVSVGSLGPGEHKVCLSPLSVSGRNQV